jgi:purine-binding chemotaxis protein CheW
MQDLYLIAEIAGSKVAIASARIESVVQIGDIIPVPKSHPSVAGLVALRSRVLTLIDCQYAITGKSQFGQKGALAVISEIDGHFYGLMLDSVADVIAIGPNDFVDDIKLSGDWDGFALRVARVGPDLVMIIDPAVLIGGTIAQAA